MRPSGRPPELEFDPSEGRGNSVRQGFAEGSADCMMNLSLLLILFHSFWVPRVFFTLLEIATEPPLIHGPIFPSIFPGVSLLLGRVTGAQRKAAVALALQVPDPGAFLPCFDVTSPTWPSLI